MTNNNVNEITITKLETVAVISYHKIVIRGLYFWNIYLATVSDTSVRYQAINVKSESINELSPGTVCLENIGSAAIKDGGFAGNFKRKSVKSRCGCLRSLRQMLAAIETFQNNFIILFFNLFLNLFYNNKYQLFCKWKVS